MLADQHGLDKPLVGMKMEVDAQEKAGVRELSNREKAQREHTMNVLVLL